ncbi:MAG TPA: amino acid ABC transporter permease [Actinomycetes bacterium]|nr:amino acid ABC transporter permease [Actinomycetes bacterium]
MTSAAASAPVHDPARLAAIASRRRRNTTVSTVSTVVVLTILVLLIVTSPGWPAVRESFFNAEYARDVLPDILKGLRLTVILFVTAEPVILVAGLLLAVVRGLTAPIFTPLRILSIAYADVVRGIPTILLIFMFGFGIPALNLQGLPDDPLFWAWVALVVSYSAYVAEVLRAGLESVHPSQRAAARALGLSQYQSLRYVVVPQAVRRVTPALLNDFIALQKDTALVAIIGAGIEMTRAAQIYAFDAFNYTPFVVAACFYIGLTVPLSRWADWMAERQRRRSQAGGGAL